MLRSRIIGTGMYLPETVMTNHDVEKKCDTSDEWIRKRTGIVERRMAKDGIGASELGTEAAKLALANAGVDAKDVDAVVCCTVTPDQVTPGAGQLIQANLGMKDSAAFDMNAACSGFVYGLATVDGFVRTGLFKRILLVGAETTSRLVNWDYRDTAVLFADGAGAVVIEAEEGDNGLLSIHIGSDGGMGEILAVHEGGFRNYITPEWVRDNPLYIRMNGRELFKQAVNLMKKEVATVLEKAGVTADEVDYFVPHQANARIIEAVRERMNLPPEKVVVNIDRMGNTVAASIPMALHETCTSGKLKAGDLVLMAAFGAGLTWGAAVMRW